MKTILIIMAITLFLALALPQVVKHIMRKRNLLSLMVLLSAASAMAQQLPTDPDVITGRLDNGLTYYVRHNETPKGQADFFIAQSVGSILEEEHQRGLAHFLEHMCFNGTKHFPGKQMIQWLESVGVKYGDNLNAYTAWDQTVYNISNVPVSRESVQDSCLLILHDWACDLLLAPEEIDAERAVIHQEWRMRNNGNQRVAEQLMPTMMPGSKYAVRFPIGTMEVVDNFPHQALRDYYETWYRPDQQAIIVVGDIDAQSIEHKIKDLFGPIPMPANAKERYSVGIDDTPGTIYAIASDPEITRTNITMFFKSDPMPRELKNTPQYYVMQTLINLICDMLNQRYAEICSKPDSPFLVAQVGYGPFMITSTKEALQLNVVAKDKDAQPSLEAAYRELLRGVRGGFTANEYDRAKSNLLSAMERQYNNRASKQNTAYAEEYVENFLNGEPIPGIGTEYQLMQMLIEQLPLDVVNGAASELIQADNRVLMLIQPEGEGFVLPTEAQLAQTMASIDAEEIEPYVDVTNNEPLIKEMPTPGTIVSETDNKQWGATEMKLSNGIKLIVKPTDFQEDEILFLAIANGGTSSMPDSLNASIKFLPLAVSKLGLGDFKNNDLAKYLSGKNVGLTLGFDDYTRQAAGSASVKDLSILMQLIYMGFTAPCIHADDFQAVQSMYAGLLANMASNPEFAFYTDLQQSLYDNSRKHNITAESVQSARIDEIQGLINAMTSNPAEYTFVFVGNIDMDVFRSLAEQYLASLRTNDMAVPVDIEPSLGIRGGLQRHDYEMAMTTPQSYMAIYKTADMPATIQNRYLAEIAGAILGQRLVSTVREEMGAVYSISASGELSRSGKPNVEISSIFPLKPECVEPVIEYFTEQFAAMEADIKQDELQKVVEYLVKNHKEAAEQNSGWRAAIGGYLINGVDNFNAALDTLSHITVQDVQDFIKEVNRQGNLQIVVLSPSN